MRSNKNLILVVVLLITTLTLAACVRPYPQPEATAVPEPDPNLILTPPAVQPEQPQPYPVQEEALPVATTAPLDSVESIEPAEEPPQDQIHIVQPGDTLFEIASQYGATIDSIITANGIVNIDALEVGQELLIPAPGSIVATPTEEVVAGETPEPAAEATTESEPAGDSTHVVQSGDNLYRIALKYGCSIDQIATANNIVNVNQLSLGQVLEIPDCN